MNKIGEEEKEVGKEVGCGGVSIDLFPKVVFLCIQDSNQGGVYGCLF